jgi:hypothetical protein
LPLVPNSSSTLEADIKMGTLMEHTTRSQHFGKKGFVKPELFNCILKRERAKLFIIFENF